MLHYERTGSSTSQVRADGRDGSEVQSLGQVAQTCSHSPTREGDSCQEQRKHVHPLVMREWEIPSTFRQRWGRGNHSISQVKKYIQDWGKHAELLPGWYQVLHSCIICNLFCQQGKRWSSPFCSPYSLTGHK